MSIAFIIYLSLLLLISAFGIVKYNQLTIPFKLLVILMPITFATELYGQLTGSLYFNTSEVHHVFYLCEYTIFGSMYYFLLRAKIPKNVVLISIIVMAVFIVLNALLWQPFHTTYPSNVVLPSQILYTLFAFLSLGQLLFDQQQVSLTKLAKQSIFWFNIAILVFACASIIPLGLVNYFAKHPEVKHNITDNFLIGAIYLSYLILAWAIWLEAASASPKSSPKERTSFEDGSLSLGEGWGEALRDDAIYVGFVLTVLTVAGVYSSDMIIAHSLLAIILWMAAFILVVCGTLIVSLKRRIKQQQKIVKYQQELVKQQQELFKYQQEQEIAKHKEELAKVRTEIQGKIAGDISYEIYQNILQVLAAVKWSLQGMAMKLKPGKTQLSLNENAGHLLQVMNDLSDLDKKNLTTKRLTELGLLEVLEDEAKKINKNGLLNVAVLITGRPRSLGEEAEVVLFRTFQVIMEGTLKRRLAQNFEIDMNYTSKGFIFTLTDDAEKFRPEGADPSKAVSIRAKVTLTPRVGGGYHMVHEVQLN